MTGEEKKRLLAEIEKQYKWLMTKSPTIYMMDIAFDAIRKAVRDEAEQEPKISLEAYKQVAKERDIAIEQLHELGYEFGEKIPTTQERQAESDKFDAAFQDGYNNGYAQARFDYEQELTTNKNDLTEQCIACKYDETEDENGEHCKKCLAGDNQFELDKEFVQPTTKNDLGVDCISRQAVIDVITANCIWENEYNLTSSRIKKAVENLPSVTPQEPKTGHWVTRPHVYGVTYCSECDFELKIDNTNFCPNCGAKMVESQESEGKQ